MSQSRHRHLRYLVTAGVVLLAVVALVWMGQFAPAGVPGASPAGDATPVAVAGDSAADRNLQQPAEPARLSIRGRVTSSEGMPASGAIVSLARVTTESIHQGEAISALDGLFTLADLKPGRYSLSAVFEDQAAGPVSIELRDNDAEVLLRLSPGVGVEVEVISLADGKPVAGATGTLVLATSQGEAGRLTAKTEADGVLRFPPASVRAERIEVEAEGYASAVKMVNWLSYAGLKWKARVSLAPGILIQGIVLDENGRPIEGVRIKGAASGLQEHEQTEFGMMPYLAVDARRFDAYFPSATSSDEGGRFSMYRQAGIPLALQLTHKNYVPRMLDILPSRFQQEVVVRLDRGHTLKGRVVDQDGHPVMDAAVSIGAAPGAEHITRSGPGGRFELPGIDGELEGMHLYAWTREANSDAVFAEPGVDIELVLTHKLQISGTVTDAEGRAVPDAAIFFAGLPPAEGEGPAMVGGSKKRPVQLTPNGEVIADGSGGFTLRGLSAGSYNITAMDVRGNRARLSLPPTGTVVADAGDHGVKVKLNPGSTLFGQLTLANGGKPRGALALEVFGLSESIPLNLDASGRFELGPINLPGTSMYELRLTGERILDKEIRVQLELGRDHNLGKVIVSAAREVTGKLTDTASGQPIFRGKVQFWSTVDGEPVASATSDDTGLYRARIPVDAESVAAQASYPMVGASRLEIVGSNTSSVDFRVPEFGELVVLAPQAEPGGFVMANADEPIPGLPASYRLGLERPTSKTFKRSLPPGVYRVSLSPPLTAAQLQDPMQAMAPGPGMALGPDQVSQSLPLTAAQLQGPVQAMVSGQGSSHSARSIEVVVTVDRVTRVTLD